VLREEYHALWSAVQQANVDLNSSQWTSLSPSGHATHAHESNLNPHSGSSTSSRRAQSPAQAESSRPLLVPEQQLESIAAQPVEDLLSAASSGHQPGNRPGSDVLGPPETPPRTPGGPKSQSQEPPAVEAVTPPLSAPRSITADAPTRTPSHEPAGQSPTKHVSFNNSNDLFETLRTVLQSGGVHVPKDGTDIEEDDSDQPSQGGSLQSDSSGSSEWSGDELLATYAAEQSNRMSNSTCPVQSLSGMLDQDSRSSDAGKDSHRSTCDLSEDISGDLGTEAVQEEETGQQCRNASIKHAKRCATSLEEWPCITKNPGGALRHS
jgi:hypothetical protein